MDVELAPCTPQTTQHLQNDPAYSYLDGKAFAEALQLPYVHWKERL